MSYAPQQQPYGQNPYGQPFSPPRGQQQGQPSYASPQPPYGQPQAQMYPPVAQQQQYAPQAGYPPPYAPQGQQYSQSYNPQQQAQYDAEYAQRPQEAYMHQQQGNFAHAPHPQASTEGFVPGKQLNYDNSSGSGNGYRDLGFLIAFLVHLILMLVLAGIYGPKLVSFLRDEPDRPPTTNPDDEEKGTSDNMMIGLLVVAAVIGGVFSIIWLSIMQRFSTQIIHISLIANIVVSGLATIAAFASGQIIMGVFYLLFTGLAALYYYFVRSRIPFATAILSSSVEAIKQNSGPVWVVYGLTVVQIAWLALWAFIFVSVYNAANKVETRVLPNGTVVEERVNNSSGLQFLQVYCVFSLYWTAQTIRNIGHVTTAGTVASWWFQPQNTSPTKPAFKRAMTTSLGSICFASLLVALIQTARFLLQQARRDACREIADCLLGLMERALKWFNSYALCTVAIYGLTFLDSAKRTGELFKAQLFTALINDDLSGMVLFCGAFLGGAIAGIVGMVWGAAQNAQGYVVMGILAFIVGFLVAMLAMGVIRSAVTTTFVCWACDPSALHQNRPVEFGRILDAGQAKYASQGIAAYSGRGGAQGV